MSICGIFIDNLPLLFELGKRTMSIKMITNGNCLPHQSIVLVKEDNIGDFSLEKILAVYKLRQKEKLECPIWELEVHPVDFCGLGCHGCSYADRHSGIEINIEKLVQTIKYYEQYDLKTVFFSGGGDPCAWKGWRSFLNYVNDRKWKLGISTNLFDFSNLKNILQEFDFLQIHIVGYDQESVFKETGVEAFDVLYNNHKSLFLRKNDGELITFKVLLRNQNFRQLGLFLDYIEMFDCDTVVIKMEQNFSGQNRVNEEIQLQTVRQIIQDHSILNKFSYCIDNLDDIVFENPAPTQCYVANSGFYGLIRADGKIYPCVAGTYDESNAYGHIGNKEEYINKKACNGTYDWLMLSGLCPLRACRHYRFNSIIERYNKGEVFDKAYQMPTLL